MKDINNDLNYKLRKMLSGELHLQLNQPKILESPLWVELDKQLYRKLEVMFAV